MSLRAIFFDIDATLFSTTAFAGHARELAVDAMIARGLMAKKEEVLPELKKVVLEFGSNDNRHYNRLLDRLPEFATRGVNKALLVTAGVIAYHEAKWRGLRVRPEAHGLLEDLSRTDIRLGVISAGLTTKQMEKVLRLGLDRFLDPGLLFITDQVGIAKTNPELYRTALSAAEVQASQAMHVGDHPLHDIDSAALAGMVTVLHRGSGKHAELKGQHRPDFNINRIGELRGILTDNFAIDI